MTELVSIIMPAYNSARFIRESIDSVLAQTYTEWELLIVDDCSTDNTKEVVQSYSDERIHYFKTPHNSGSGVARNMGIEAAKGRYIAFIDGDDWWYPEKLERQIAFMQDNKYDFTCTWYEDAREDLTPYHISRPHDTQNLKYMRFGNEVGTPGVIFDTYRFGKVFMPNYRKAQDWGLWLRILNKVDYLHVCPFVSFKYRHNADSATHNKWKMFKAVMTIYQEELHYSYFKAIIIFTFGFMPRNIKRKIERFVTRNVPNA